MSSDGLRGVFLGSTLRIAVTAVVGLAVVIGIAVLLGVLGVPAVETVQNEFGAVNDSTTVIGTDLTVTNPNPIGVTLGGSTVNYTVYMNDVRMANGLKRGLAVQPGRSTLSFATRMRNERIPPWWVSHIENDETTEVLIDARITSSLLGGRTFELPQERTVETDLIGNFNSEETRPIEANRPVVEDPVLYVNETSASWDREALSAERTPIDMGFTVHNPKPYPYVVSEIGYEIRMNGILVGEGSSDDVATIAPGATETIDTRTAIRNGNLDEWWVSHLQRDQVTNLTIDFSLVVDPVEEDGPIGGLDGTVGQLELPVEPLDYEETIETDIFGTKTATNASAEGSAEGSASSDSDGESTDDDTATATAGSRDDGTATDAQTPTRTDTPTPTPTPADDGGLLGGSDASTAEPTLTETPQSSDSPPTTPTPTDTPTPTETPADDGGLLG
jgi:LEA14-like dessication related protein